MSTGELLIKLLTGSAVGYISSLVSLKVIFGKYSLINNTNNYSDFKNHLAESLEKNLLKESYIKNQLETSLFKNELNDILEDFINNTLDKNIPSIEFKDLKGYEELKSNITTFINENNFIKNIDLNKILAQVNIKDLFNEEDLKHFSTKIYQTLSPIITPDIKPLILDIYEQIKDNKINDILGEDTLNKLKNNINPLLDSLKDNIKSIEPEINNTIKEVWKEINVDQILINLEHNIKNKSIIELIGLENKDKLTTELITHFIDFVKSDEGKSFVNKLSVSLLKMIKEIDSPIINFLMPILQVKIFNFLENNIPYLAENAKEWLRINKKEIEIIIEDTIEEYYSKQDLMGQLKLKVKDVIGLKISEYFQVVEKGIEKFEDYIKTNASKDLTGKLVEFLDNKNISDIVKQLNLKSETLSDFFHIFVNNYLPKVNTKIFDSVLNKKIGDINLFKISLKDEFGDKLESLVLDKIKSFILSDYINNKIKELIPEKFENFKVTTLGEIITKEKLDGYLGFLPMFLMFSQGKIIDTIKTQLNSFIDKNELNQLINDNTKKIIKDNLSEIYINKSKDVINKIDNIDIKKIYYHNKNFDKLTIIESIKNNSSNFIENQLTNNIREQNLNLSNDYLNNTIEKYIGNEYTPILLISSLIGLLYAVLIYFLELGLLNTQNYITPIAYFIMAIFISYISQQMLFKPYEKSFAFKRKNIFSESISNTLESNLKNSENIFNEREKQNLKNYISKDNYSFLKKIEFSKASENFTDKSIDYIYKNMEEQDISKLLLEKSANFELHDISKERFNNIFTSIINKSQDFLTDFFAKRVYSYKDKDLNSLPEKLRLEIEEVIKLKVTYKVQELIKSLKETDLTQKFKDSLEGVENFLNFDIKLSEAYLPDDILKEKIVNKLSKIIKDKIPEGINKYIEKNFIEEELSSDKEISTLFNGELIIFAKTNISFLIDKILLDFGLEKLKTQKENISENIIKSVREANKDNFLYGLGESFFSIDTDIENIVHLLIDDKLEPYLQNKKYELNSLLIGFIDILSRKKLEELGLDNEIFNSKNIASLVEKFVNHNNISDSINHMSLALVNDILNLKVSFILNMLGISNLKDIPEKVSEQINMIKNQFIENIENNDKFNLIIDNFTKYLINKGVFSQKLEILFKDIDLLDITNSIDKIIADLYKTDVFTNYRDKFFESIYISIENKKVSDFINIESLDINFKNTINKLINNDFFKIELKNILNPFINNLISQINIILPNDTKDYILDILIKSISESINKNSLDIINSLETRNMIQKGINNISKSEMELLFSDITEFNIKNSLVYGSIGAIIGILDIVILKYYG